MAEQFLSEKQVCDLLGISRSTLAAMRKKGLPYFQVNFLIRYRESEVTEWLRNTVKTNKETTKNE